MLFDNGNTMGLMVVLKLKLRLRVIEMRLKLIGLRKLKVKWPSLKVTISAKFQISGSIFLSSEVKF